MAVLPPPAPTPLVLTWTVEGTNDWRWQTFQFIGCTNIVQPHWQILTNVVNANVVAFPKEYEKLFITIGATWLTDEGPFKGLRWDKWK